MMDLHINTLSKIGEIQTDKCRILLLIGANKEKTGKAGG